MLTTFHYRVKDASRGRYLDRWKAVNFVWNYCNNAQKHAVRWGQLWPTKFDLHALTSGSSKELGLHSQTIQAICDQYVKSRDQHRKQRLRYRGRLNLGWVPFKASGIRHLGDGSFKFGGKVFKTWYSRELRGAVKCGSFSQDSLGRWFISITCDVQDDTRLIAPSGAEIGIDLGLKTFASCSDGTKIDAEPVYRNAEANLAKAQRAHKKKQVKRIACGVKNKRKDFHHKVSTNLVRQYGLIVVGNVNSSSLVKTRMAKSVLDAGWSQFRTMLGYKAIAHQVRFKVVDERFSTQTCCDCKEVTGPKGIACLGKREWTCSACGMSHDRDTNAAQNILRVGRDTLVAGIPVL